MASGSLPKWTALPNPVFCGSSYGVPWWAAFQETAPLFILPWVNTHRKCLRLCWLCDFASLILSIVTDTSSKLGQWLCGQWPQNARILQLRLSWMLLWVPVWHPQMTPPRRQSNHPPLLIFPADLVVWMLPVFCFMVATFLSLMS